MKHSHKDTEMKLVTDMFLCMRHFADCNCIDENTARWSAEHSYSTVTLYKA